MQALRVFHGGAIASLVLLIAWLLAWEIVVAPLHPGGSLLALKALPLLLPLRGVVKRDIYTLQWSAMVILLYFIEGVVRGWSDTAPLSRIMAYGEIVLVCVFFACALLYLRPYKKAAKRMAKELLDKVKVAHD
ncbi:MAG: DUF2069 domain-containing protein [Pseudomonadota bacterium]|nr:DUF2069 domain-containing protein [Pseudomonadota bacterium]